MNKALIVIDIQNDYFKGGAYPLCNTDKVLENIKKAIEICKERKIPVVLVKHESSGGLFFNKGTFGIEIHDEIKAISKDSELIIKNHADAFYETNLESVLNSLKVDAITICGMMTQNCVTHTAISETAKKYKKVTVIEDCSTSVDPVIHGVGMNVLSKRVTIKTLNEI